MFQAVSYQKKAVIVCERIFGVDHPDTIIAYVSSSYHEGSTLVPVDMYQDIFENGDFLNLF